MSLLLLLFYFETQRKKGFRKISTWNSPWCKLDPASKDQGSSPSCGR